MLVAIETVIDLAKERSDGPVIAGNGPITEDQVRQKMAGDGWTNLQISREGRSFQVMGSKDQQTVTSWSTRRTGRLRGDDDD